MNAVLLKKCFGFNGISVIYTRYKYSIQPLSKVGQTNKLTVETRRNSTLHSS